MSAPCWGDRIMHFIACSVTPVALLLLVAVGIFSAIMLARELLRR